MAEDTEGRQFPGNCRDDGKVYFRASPQDFLGFSALSAPLRETKNIFLKRRGDRRENYRNRASFRAFRAVVLSGIPSNSSAENQRKCGPGTRTVADRTVKV